MSPVSHGETPQRGHLPCHFTILLLRFRGTECTQEIDMFHQKHHLQGAEQAYHLMIVKYTRTEFPL